MADPPIVSLKYLDSELGKSLLELSKRCQDLTPALKECREILLLDTDERFETETDPDGNPWVPNTPYTIGMKRAQGRILKILQSSGRGRSSITGQIFDGKTLVVGTNVGYMRKHQVGDGVRQRVFLGISKKARSECVEVIRDYAIDGDGSSSV